MATDIGKAYVQIVPSAKGIGGSISSLLNGEAASAGVSAGSTIGDGLVSSIKGIIATAGIGMALKSALTQGADLQQSLGGVETLFKDSSDKVKEYAKQSFQTTGLSANEYMESVTSFSASLISSLSGDTNKAADISNTAMTDMADNSNKMGTAMGSIQDAYQGFAKQNYTMLDNLKLGYGGTKTEMERLLADATKISGVQYDVSNLSDVYSAIHVIQGEMGITGTTAKEAASTFTGSINSMKAAAKDLVGNIAIGADISDNLINLGSTIQTFVFSNLLPMVQNVITGFLSAVPEIITGLGASFPEIMSKINTFIIDIIQALVDSLPAFFSAVDTIIAGISDGISQQMPVIVEAIPEIIIEIINAIIDGFPLLLQASIELLDALIQAIPTVIAALVEALPQIITSIVEFLITGIPMLIQGAIQLLDGIVQAIPLIIESLTAALPQIITAIVSGLITGIPVLIQGSIQLFMAICEAIPQIVGALIEAMPQIIEAIVLGIANGMPDVTIAASGIYEAIIGFFIDLPNSIAGYLDSVIANLISWAADMISKGYEGASGFFGAVVEGLASLPDEMMSIGSNIVSGIWNGISSGWSWLVEEITGAASSLVSSVASSLGIHSPSKAFADKVGYNIPSGIGVGVKRAWPNLVNTMKTMAGSLAETVSGNMNLNSAIPEYALEANTAYTRYQLPDSAVSESGTTYNVYIDGIKWNDGDAMDKRIVDFVSAVSRRGQMYNG